MAYIFDSGPLIVLFRHYYPNRFPTLWKKFESMVENQEIVSVREVFNEITSYGNVDRLVVWAKNHKEIFLNPTPSELTFVSEIFKIKHFQGMISKKGMMQGKPIADPFIVAKAKISESTVVTLERWKRNSAKMPNVCEYFGVESIDLERFMEAQNWVF